MNIIYLQKENILRSPVTGGGRPGIRISLLFVSAFLIFSVSCATDTENHSKEAGLLKPSLAFFGDSISAFWPIEEQFSEFNTFKEAFPGRRTVEIQEAAKNDTSHYRACMLNGGVNDFLNNNDPSWKEVDETVSRQLETAEILKSRCDYLIVLNVWRVEPPWPVAAASMISTELKQRVVSVPRVDPEDLIQSDMLLDGGHLTDEGYRVLSERVKTTLRLTLPEFWIGFL